MTFFLINFLSAYNIILLNDFFPDKFFLSFLLDRLLHYENVDHSSSGR